MIKLFVPTRFGFYKSPLYTLSVYKNEKYLSCSVAHSHEIQNPPEDGFEVEACCIEQNILSICCKFESAGAQSKYCVSYFVHSLGGFYQRKPMLEILCPLRNTLTYLVSCGPGSSVGIATDYGLNGPGSNPGGYEIFRPSRLVVGPTQPPVNWVPGLYRG